MISAFFIFLLQKHASRRKFYGDLVQLTNYNELEALTSSKSLVTIRLTSSSKEISLFQPSFSSALAGLPSRSSTSAGRKNLGLTLTTVLPEFLSTPVSLTPSPFHSMSIPTCLKAVSANSRTVLGSLVAITK